MPYPEQEQNAVDVVLQFAIHKLGFQPENIILFGWSIGGYCTSWAAKTYPDIKAVVCTIWDFAKEHLIVLCLQYIEVCLGVTVSQTTLALFYTVEFRITKDKFWYTVYENIKINLQIYLMFKCLFLTRNKSTMAGWKVLSTSCKPK